MENLLQQPNLELESFKIEVTSPGQVVKISDKTKIEHKKLVGIFAALKGGNYDNYDSKIQISIDGESIISRNKFHAFLLEKTNYLSIPEASFKLNKEISTSDINIIYEDGHTLASTNYIYTIYLICEKK